MNKCQINQRLWSQVKEPNDVMYGWCHRSLIKGSNIWSLLRSLLSSRKEVWYSLERSKFSKNILQNWDRKTVGPFCTGGQQGWRTGGSKGVAPGVKRGGASPAPPSAPPFMTPLFLKKKRSKEVAPLLNPGATLATPGTKWSDNLLLILFDNFDHSALYHTSFLYEIRPFHLFPRGSL